MESVTLYWGYNVDVTHADEAKSLPGMRGQFVGDLALTADERVDSVFDLENGLVDDGQDLSEVLVLTTRRIVHLKGKDSRRRVVFMPLRNVDAVEVTNQRERYGAFVWAGLALLVALMVWQIWDNALAPLAALIVLAMGVYLVVDRLMFPGNAYAVVNSGSSQIRLEITSEPASRDIYEFSNHLFQLQDEVANGRSPSAIRFPPR